MFILDNKMKINLGFLSKLKNKKPSRGGSKQFTFIALAFVMLVVVALFVIYSFTFLISEFNDVSGQQISPPPVPRFDIQGFEKLDLTK
ncbi:MAG: hypothetical protein UY26_C0003G0047 [Candidatus Jorgensenbacteria bacterium GW2011_GWA1_48_13]|uniref:Uncharacterized protein n=2 Tax=Candidatus Joergenseniibacteriota TaxID=1752739 RepID=A0A0G1W8H0_9BACT|nr:MAG: hypothetical protein UY26_C0003G0047 [Candidatus Jorgensenbacteria bacterium GW2011_GWA1_48_13]KKU99324.1 MAG: hypothetical protein UY32_C0002G0060 [Candidatus Jorgensenbacteria bacterium GW2011_GWC1_48_8]KKW15008.1 MAG: hypothetical protein UY55_C0002G0064 [Candidatus Jorgensenbacteria bacterium GW2011_GWB1_50_10]